MLGLLAGKQNYAQQTQTVIPLDQHNIFPKKELRVLDSAYALIKAKNKKAYSISSSLLENTKNRYSQIYAFIIIGLYFNTIDQQDSSLFYGNKALKKLPQVNDSIHQTLKYLAYDVIGGAQADKNLLHEAKLTFLKGIVEPDKIKEKTIYRRRINLASILN